MRYETFVADDQKLLFRLRDLSVDGLVRFGVAATLAGGAAGRTQLRDRGRYATEPDPIVLADPGESVIRSRSSLAAADGAVLTATHAHELDLGTDLQITRIGVG